MKADLKAITVPEIDYINLSEQLREELELKIENLYKQNRFVKYANSHGIPNYQNAAKADFLCAYLMGRPPGNYVLSGKLLQGIKIWFNMYYDDRLSVIDKFRICYQRVKPHHESSHKRGASVVFCKFLINELLSILADSRWQILIEHANKVLEIKSASLN